MTLKGVMTSDSRYLCSSRVLVQYLCDLYYFKSAKICKYLNNFKYH